MSVYVVTDYGVRLVWVPHLRSITKLITKARSKAQSMSEFLVVRLKLVINWSCDLGENCQ